MLIIIGFILFLSILLIRAIRFKPVEEEITSVEPVSLNKEKVLYNFTELLKYKTISYHDRSQMVMKEFEGFQSALSRLYPEVTKHCERQLIGPTGILYKWAGQKSIDPVIFMSHYDVVPVEEKFWKVHPFKGEIKDGFIWGRGTLDTKCTLAGIMEAAELLLREGYTPENDIYFAFAGDEETSGNSAPEIVKYLKAHNIKPTLVLDEGGVIVDDVFPGVKNKVALIGTGEKGYLDIIIRGASQGGHASAPPSKTLNLKMASAIMNVEKKGMKAHFTLPVKALFNRLGRHSTFGYKLIFSNMWLFSPLLKVVFKLQGGQMNALIRTTMAVTKMEGSKAFNVLPSESSIGINCRILNTDTVQDCMNHIQSVVDEEEFTYEILESREASKISSEHSNAFKLVSQVINSLWSDVIVSPYLMTAATDSRHFTEICDNVLRFAPISLSNEQLGLIHSNNERIGVATYLESIQFFIEIMRRI